MAFAARALALATACAAVVAASEEPTTESPIAMVPVERDPLICEPGGGGLVLPLFGEEEQLWPNKVRIILYLIGLLWTFAGVAIVADIFMAGIEEITSQEKRVKVLNPTSGKLDNYSVKIWNDTIANLSLMALGSSAPEILLSCIELFSNQMYSGELGPSTIVGSAAFNLLIIIAVCVCAIPDDQTRKIKQYSVFVVTASCSLFAYVWLVVILVVTSPDIVEAWEGILTFLFFPILLWVAYNADRGKLDGLFNEKKRQVQNIVIQISGGASVELDKDELARITKKIKQEYGDDIDDSKLAELVSQEASQKPKSRAYYRVNATRMMTGGAPVDTGKPTDYEQLKSNLTPRSETKNVIQFEAAAYSVLEAGKEVKIKVIRSGDDSSKVSVNYETRDGDGEAAAQVEKDYKKAKGTLTFKKGQREQSFTVGIIDDVAIEPDEHFFVDLSNVVSQESKGGEKHALGKCSTTKVTIINDDLPGKFKFAAPLVECVEDCGAVTIVVERVDGCAGVASVDYRTKDGIADHAALKGADYKETKGTLVFAAGEYTKTISVEIVDDARYEADEHFFVLLENPKMIDPPEGVEARDYPTLVDAKEGEGTVECEIVIKNDEATKNTLDGILGALQINPDKASLGAANYCDQFKMALSVGGGETDAPGCGDYAFHFICLPWKILFAFIPPTTFMGGWACFFVALCVVGSVTAIIGDMAGLLGCCAGMPDAFTAITLVALGTSLPDTFASKAAATGDPFADNSIGNVTGSNSVNVFLGLGLPWMIGALHWGQMGTNMPDEWYSRYPEIAARTSGVNHGFAVPAGSLGSSVAVFCMCTVLCIGTLIYRRKTLGYELGGDPTTKYRHAAFFIFLWFVYLGFSAYQIFVVGA